MPRKSNNTREMDGFWRNPSRRWVDQYLVTFTFLLFVGSVAHASEIRTLLLNGEFAVLEEKISKLREGVETDIALEAELDVMLDAFNVPTADITEPLDRWVAASPGSDIALLARGIHRTAVGWELRGNNFAPKTTRRQFRNMRESMAHAWQDLENALKINPRSIHAHAYQIEILMAVGEGRRTRPILDAALKISELSETVRWYYLSILLPRWGGSMEAMSEFVASVKPLYAANPSLRALEARIPAEIGDRHLANRNYSAAVTAYEQALAIAPHWYFYRRHGEALVYMGQYEKAHKSLDEALRLRPDYAPVYEHRGWAYYMTDDYAPAVEALTHAIELGRLRASNFSIRGESQMALGNLSDAESDLAMAVALNPEKSRYRALLNKVRALTAPAD